MPSLERIQAELGSAKSIDDFFGKEGIFARLFATTLEQMLDAELTAELGYEKYEAKGRNSGNSRNGKYKRKVRSSSGQVEVAVPRDRTGRICAEAAAQVRNVEQRTGRQNHHAVRQRAVGAGCSRQSARDVRGRCVGSDNKCRHGESVAAGRSLAEPTAGQCVSHRVSGCHSRQLETRRTGRNDGHLYCSGG